MSFPPHSPQIDLSRLTRVYSLTLGLETRTGRADLFYILSTIKYIEKSILEQMWGLRIILAMMQLGHHHQKEKSQSQLLGAVGNRACGWSFCGAP